MSVFTDRMIAAGVVDSIAAAIESDLLSDLAVAKAGRARKTAAIDTKQSELDALRAERAAFVATIDNIRTTLGDPNA